MLKDGLRAAALAVVLCRPAAADQVNIMGRDPRQPDGPVIAVALGLHLEPPGDLADQQQCLEQTEDLLGSGLKTAVTWDLSGMPPGWWWPPFPLDLSLHCIVPADDAAGWWPAFGGGGAGGGGGMLGGGGASSGGLGLGAFRADGSVGLGGQDLPFFPEPFIRGGGSDAAGGDDAGPSNSSPSSPSHVDLLDAAYGPGDLFEESGNGSPGGSGPGGFTPPGGPADTVLTPVPEPATLLLTAAGLAAGWRMRRTPPRSRGSRDR